MDYIRTIVSGKKKRFIDRKYNLDLSYITPRIIAMAYPASGIETIFRNSINSVSKFLKERHDGNYLVINLSGKKYDNAKFEHKVQEYKWVDHHAPPLMLLFTICREMFKFLQESNESVIVVNCRAGKGRTGTVICCFLLFSGRFNDPEDAFAYYSSKRFNVGEGVTQPSQRRYVHYFHKLLKEKLYFPLVRTIRAIMIDNPPTNLTEKTFKPFFEIFYRNSDQISVTNKTTYSNQKKIYANNTHEPIAITDTDFQLTVSGDITIKLYNNKLLSVKKIGRIAFNTAFFDPETKFITFNLSEIDPDNLAKKKSIPKDFKIILKVTNICDCQNNEMAAKLCETCSELLAEEINFWKDIRTIIEEYYYSQNKHPVRLLFGNEEDDVEKILNNEDIEEEIGVFDDDGHVKEVKKVKEKKEDLNSSFDNECRIF